MALSIIVKSIEIGRDYSFLLSVLSVLPLGLFFLKKELSKSTIDPVRWAKEKMAIAILLSFITALLTLVFLIGAFSTGSFLDTKGFLGLGLVFLGLTFLLIYIARKHWRIAKELSKNKKQ